MTFARGPRAVKQPCLRFAVSVPGLPGPDGCAHPAIRAGAPCALVFANILARPLQRLARAIVAHTAAGGTIIAVHAIKSAVQRARTMTLETIAPLSDDPIVSLPALAG